MHTTAIPHRVDALDWAALGEQLDTRGFAITDPLLSEDECAELAGAADPTRSRTTRCWSAAGPRARRGRRR